MGNDCILRVSSTIFDPESRTTVSKNVEPYKMVIGAGQRSIGYRDKDNFNKCLNSGNFYGKYY